MKSEKAMQPELECAQNSLQIARAVQEEAKLVAAEHLSSPAASSPVIWNPRFMVIFFLLLVGGLSAASLLTQGWLNGYYSGSWPLLGYGGLLFGAWATLIVRTRSLWVRCGAIFGCIWSIFMTINYVLYLLPIDPHASILAHLNAATTSALLGSYICLSVERTPFRRWDNWFFKLTLIVGCVLVVAIFFFSPATVRSLPYLESVIAAVSLYLCIAVWWIRPSCWRAQLAPTFLFGIGPIILLLLAIPNLADGATNYFFTQIFLLSILLATVRILQCEIRH